MRFLSRVADLQVSEKWSVDREVRFLFCVADLQVRVTSPTDSFAKFFTFYFCLFVFNFNFNFYLCVSFVFYIFFLW